MKEIFFQKYYGAVTGEREVQSHSKFDLSLYTNLNCNSSLLINDIFKDSLSWTEFVRFL